MRKKNVTVYCGASFGVDEKYQEKIIDGLVNGIEKYLKSN